MADIVEVEDGAAVEEATTTGNLISEVVCVQWIGLQPS